MLSLSLSPSLSIPVSLYPSLPLALSLFLSPSLPPSPSLSLSRMQGELEHGYFEGQGELRKRNGILYQGHFSQVISTRPEIFWGVT